MPFDDYVEKNIFQPLGMNTLDVPPAVAGQAEAPDFAGLQQGIAAGRRTSSLCRRGRAGSMSVSADDMSHYMIAHLQDGEYNGARILKPETAQLMHSRAFGLAPELNGMAYGFYEESRNGHRIIGHGGDTQWFHSDMHLMLDDHLGFFISYNSAGQAGFLRTEALWQGSWIATSPTHHLRPYRSRPLRRT